MNSSEKSAHEKQSKLQSKLQEQQKLQKQLDSLELERMKMEHQLSAEAENLKRQQVVLKQQDQKILSKIAAAKKEGEAQLRLQQEHFAAQSSKVKEQHELQRTQMQEQIEKLQKSRQQAAAKQLQTRKTGEQLTEEILQLTKEATDLRERLRQLEFQAATRLNSDPESQSELESESAEQTPEQEEAEPEVSSQLRQEDLALSQMEECQHERQQLSAQVQQLRQTVLRIESAQKLRASELLEGVRCSKPTGRTEATRYPLSRINLLRYVFNESPDDSFVCEMQRLLASEHKQDLVRFVDNIRAVYWEGGVKWK